MELGQNELVMFLLLQDSYIVDNGEAGVWVWNGKQASKQERSEAMRNAVVSTGLAYRVMD